MLSSSSSLCFFLLFSFLTAPLLAHGFSCSTEMSPGEEHINSATATTTSGCKFSHTVKGKYIYLNVEQMVQAAVDAQQSEVAVSITDTIFTDIGLKINGYSGSVPNNAVPLKISIMTNEVTNTLGTPCLFFTGKLPPRSVITIKENTLSSNEKEALSSDGLTLTDETHILLEGNTMNMTSSAKENLGVWGDNSLFVTGGSTIKLLKNTMTGFVEGLASNSAGAQILYQSSSSGPVTIADNSLLLWQDNNLSVTAPSIASMWYPLLRQTSLRVINHGNVTWVGNTMKATVTHDTGYPYIWYTDSAEVTGQGSISFRDNKMNVYAWKNGRIWYQRIVTTVSGEGSYIVWERNNITATCEGGDGDNSIWFQGSPNGWDNTDITISNKGLVKWAHNNITMVGGHKRHLWRQWASATSTTTISDEGAIHWINNTISSTGSGFDMIMWYQTAKIKFSISGRSTVAWWNNTIAFGNKKLADCVACLETKTFTVDSNSVIAFENNTLDVTTIATSGSTDVALFQGPFSMTNAFVKINRNIFTFSDRLKLARLWAITAEAAAATTSSISLCRNRYNMYYMTLYAGYVAPPSLVPFIEPNCPFTDTSTGTDTPTFTSTATTTSSVSSTATSTMTATSSFTWFDNFIPTATKTQTMTDSLTASSTLSLSQTSTSAGTGTLSTTVTSTATSGITQSDTALTTATRTVTTTSTPTTSSTLSQSHTPALSTTNTLAATRTLTAISTLSATSTLTLSETPTKSMISTPTSTAASTLSVTNTVTGTSTATPTSTPTASSTPTLPHTFTSTLIDTSTVTGTNTVTTTSTPTATSTLSRSQTSTKSMISTPTSTAASTPSATNTVTGTSTATTTNTATTTSSVSLSAPPTLSHTRPRSQSTTASLTLTASDTRDTPDTATVSLSTTETLRLPALSVSPTEALPPSPSATPSSKGTQSATLPNTGSVTRAGATTRTLTTTKTMTTTTTTAAPTTVVAPTTIKQANDSAARADAAVDAAEGDRSGYCYLYLCIILPIIIGALLLCCCLLIICLCCRAAPYKHELLDDVEPCTVHHNLDKEANGQAPPNMCVCKVPSDDNGFSDPFPQPKLQQEGTAEGMPEDDDYGENPFQIPKPSAYEETIEFE